MKSEIKTFGHIVADVKRRMRPGRTLIQAVQDAVRAKFPKESDEALAFTMGTVYDMAHRDLYKAPPIDHPWGR